MVRKTRDFIEGGDLLPRRGCVIVGLSGGPDSVALLRILLELCERGGADRGILAAHLDHGIRRRAARLDARFCRELCARLSVPFIEKSADVPALAKKGRLSIEEAARQARFDFFEEVVKKVLQSGDSHCVVALGHQLDDQAETVLLRVFRGTGVPGLGGIPPARDLKIKGVRVPVRLVRPLLAVSREEILGYLRDIRQPYRIDKSNVSAQYTRNRVRYEVLPLLKKCFNPNVARALANLADISRQWAKTLEGLGRCDLLYVVEGEPLERWTGEGRVRLNADALAELQPPVGQHVLRSILHALKIPLKKMKAEHFRRVLALAAAPAPRTVQLPENLDARREKEWLVLEKRPPRGPLSPRRRKGAVLKTGRVNELPGFGLKITIGRLPVLQMRSSRSANARGVRPLPSGRRVGPPPRCLTPSQPVWPDALKKFVREKSPLEEMLDSDRLTPPLRARHPREGDVFQPLGHSREAPLTRFLAKQGLPAAERARVVVVADRKRIVWVVGLRISENVKVTQKTRRAIYLCAREAARKGL
ncbi:MAG: tRNA lysidine(34) synthetase TilS [Planctomycetota bacterium]